MTLDYDFATQNYLEQKRQLELKKRQSIVEKRSTLAGMIKKEEALPNPVADSTSSLLKQAWLNLIPSFGLTLLWINLHAFLNKVLGKKFFCKLGEEWVPKEVKKKIGEAGKTTSRAIGLLEAGLLGLIDLVVLSVLFLVISLFIAAVDYTIHPWKIFFD